MHISSYHIISYQHTIHLIFHIFLVFKRVLYTHFIILADDGCNTATESSQTNRLLRVFHSCYLHYSEDLYSFPGSFKTPIEFAIKVNFLGGMEFKYWGMLAKLLGGWSSNIGGMIAKLLGGGMEVKYWGMHPPSPGICSPDPNIKKMASKYSLSIC